MGAGLLVALLAALGLGRARRSGLRSAAFLFASVALVVQLGSVAVSLFSWRYQLPQLVLVPPAAALGVTAFMRRRDRTRARPTETSARGSGRERAESESKADGRASAKPGQRRPRSVRGPAAADE